MNSIREFPAQIFSIVDNLVYLYVDLGFHTWKLIGFNTKLDTKQLKRGALIEAQIEYKRDPLTTTNYMTPPQDRDHYYLVGYVLKERKVFGGATNNNSQP